MKKVLLIIFSLYIVWGFNNKWDIATNTNSYPLVKFKVSKSYIDEEISRYKERRAYIYGKDNRQKFLGSDGYYRFSMKAVVFTNKEGALPINMTKDKIDKLVSPIYKRLNSMNFTFKNATTLDDFTAHGTSAGKEWLLGALKKKKMRGDEYLKIIKNIRNHKVHLIAPYKNGIFIYVTFKSGIHELIGIRYLVKNGEKWLEDRIFLNKRVDMNSTIESLLKMNKGDLSQIITSGDDGKDYPIVSIE